jgi:hypothetical protein
MAESCVEKSLPPWEIDLATNSVRWLVADIVFCFSIRFRQFGDSDDFSPSDLRARMELPPKLRLSRRAARSLRNEARELLYAAIVAELDPSARADLRPPNDFPEAKTA